MTVCIAALYGDGTGAVLVSDQMVTAHIPIGYEYEQEATPKIIPVGTTHALLAGDVLRGNEVIGLARRNLAQHEGAVSATDVAECVRQAYQQVRLTTVIHTELEPRGLNLGDFYARHQQLSPQVVQMVDQAMSQTNIQVEILIAGPSDGRHMIHTVLNPGVVFDNTAVGHGAIGSGAPHALAFLIENSYSPSLGKDEVLKMVRDAKARSEIAPGVGSSTTELVIPTEERD